MKKNTLLVILMVLVSVFVFASVTFSVSMTQCDSCCGFVNGSSSRTVSVSPYTSNLNLLLNE